MCATFSLGLILQDEGTTKATFKQETQQTYNTIQVLLSTPHAWGLFRDNDLNKHNQELHYAWGDLTGPCGELKWPF